MANTIHPIDKLIADKAAEIDETESRLERLRIELGTLKKAREAVPDIPVGRRRSGRGRRGRSLSDTWKRALSYVGTTGERGASTDEILEFSNRTKLGIERHTLRSQMSIYGERGLVERVRPGIFILTAKGRSAVAQKESGPDEESSGPIQGSMQIS